LQEHRSVCFILGSPCKFQALRGEATELVRRAHSSSPNLNNKAQSATVTYCMKTMAVIDLRQ
jgi:hypothetical protein